MPLYIGPSHQGKESSLRVGSEGWVLWHTALCFGKLHIGHGYGGRGVVMV